MSAVALKNLLASSSKASIRPAYKRISINIWLASSFFKSFSTNLLIKATTYSPISSTFLVQELDEISFRTTTFIRLRLFVVLSKELDGGEGANFVFSCKRCICFCISVDISNNTLETSCTIKSGTQNNAVVITYITLWKECLCNIIVNGLHPFAVSTPRRLETGSGSVYQWHNIDTYRKGNQYIFFIILVDNIFSNIRKKSKYKSLP